MSIEPADDRTRAPFGRGELDAEMQRKGRRPECHPRHDEVRARLLDVPAARGEHSPRIFRQGDHYALYADGRAVWFKPERGYAVNDWWQDEAGRTWAIDDGALDGLLHGLAQSRRGIDGFLADLEALNQPQAPDEDDETDAY